MNEANTEFALIQWNGQRDTLFKSLSHLRNSELYTDVLVSCEDSFYPAHRLILSLSSEYFAKAFQLLPNSGYPIFVLCGIPKRILEAMLNYIYEGKVTIINEDVAPFMKAGIFLEIAGLRNVDKNVMAADNGNVTDNEVSCLHEIVNCTTRLVKQESDVDEDIDVVNINSFENQNETFNGVQFNSAYHLKKICSLEENNISQISSIDNGNVNSDVNLTGSLEQNNMFHDCYDDESKKIQLELLIEENLHPISNIAKKQTRSCQRCDCCDRMFSSKRALTRHYFQKKNVNINRNSLRSSKEPSDKVTLKKNKRKSKFHKFPFNQNKDNNSSNIAAEELFIGNGADKVTFLKEPLNINDNLDTNSNGCGNETLDTTRPNKRLKINSNNEEMAMSSNACFQLINSNLDINIPTNCEANIETTLQTETGAFTFSISDIVSLKEDLPLSNAINEEIISEVVSDVPKCNGEFLETVGNAKLKDGTYIDKEVIIDSGGFNSIETVNKSKRKFMSEDEHGSELSSCNESVVTCEICSSQYASFNSYKNHKKTDCRILECPYCFHTFLPSKKSFLDLHMSIHLKEERPFTCPECPYRTSKSKVMRDHIAIHKGIFRFWCPLCNFKGKSVKKLQTHNEINHPNMKVFD